MRKRQRNVAVEEHSGSNINGIFVERKATAGGLPETTYQIVTTQYPENQGGYFGLGRCIPPATRITTAGR